MALGQKSMCYSLRLFMAFPEVVANKFNYITDGMRPQRTFSKIEYRKGVYLNYLYARFKRSF